MAATLQLTAHEVAGSIDIQKNTSRLYVCLQITTTAGTYNHAGDTTGTITVNGQVYRLDGKNVDYNTTTVLYEHTHTIAHTSDGSKSVTVAAVFDPNTPGTSQMQAGKTVILTHIPRASTIAATDADIGAVSMVAVNRRSETYTHSILCQMGAVSGWLNADGALVETEQKLTQTAIGFLIPESFYGQIPDSPAGICTLTCTTYAQEVPIGEPQTARFTVTANAEICAPRIELTITDSNPATTALTGDPTVMVLHASTALCKLNATAQKGASIAKRVVAGQELDGDTLTVPAFAEESLSGSVTDSRGYSVSFHKQIQAVHYIPLTANLTAGRTDPTSGKALVSVKGNYFPGSFGLESNTLVITCRTADQETVMLPTIDETGYQAEVVLEGLDYLTSHTVSIIASDRLTTLERTVVVGKGIPVFDWGEKDFRFNVPVTVPDPTADAHAVNRGYVSQNTIGKTGGTASGAIYMGNGSGVQTDAAWASIGFKNLQGQTRASIMTTQNNALHFNNHPTAGYPYAERFYFPTPDGDLQADVWYAILTSKSPVTVAQGGTGAKTAAAARSNLGIGCTKVISASLSAAGNVATANCHGSYKLYLVMGTPAQGGSITTMVIPSVAVTTSKVKYQLADNADYVSFYLSCSGTKLSVEKAAGNGVITAVYGIN